MNLKVTMIVLCLILSLLAPMAHAEDTVDSGMDWATFWTVWAQFELKVAEFLIGGPTDVLNMWVTE